jgi:hypothetical protein
LPSTIRKTKYIDSIDDSSSDQCSTNGSWRVGSPEKSAKDGVADAEEAHADECGSGVGHLEKGKGCGWEEKGEGAGSDAEGGEESDEGRHFSGMRYEGVWLGLEIVCRVTVMRKRNWNLEE